MTKPNRLVIPNPSDEDIAIAFGAVKLAWVIAIQIHWSGTLTVRLMSDTISTAPAQFREWLAKHQTNRRSKTEEIKHAPEII